MGTTVATNTLLERQGAKMALFITRGFRVSAASFLAHAMIANSIAGPTQDWKPIQASNVRTQRPATTTSV